MCFNNNKNWETICSLNIKPGLTKLSKNLGQKFGASKSVVDDLVFYVPPIVCVVLCWSLFRYALIWVYSSFAIILTRRRGLVALILLSCGCIVTVNVLWLFLTLLWDGMQCVIVVFLDYTHFLL